MNQNTKMGLRVVSRMVSLILAGYWTSSMFITKSHIDWFTFIAVWIIALIAISVGEK
jgi:hypothetical protein